MRQSLREQRHGYSRDPRKRRGGGIEAGIGVGTSGGSPSLGGGFRFGGWLKSGGAAARASDEELLSDDSCGDPSLSSLLTDEDRARYAAVDPANRFNVVVADIQRVVERNRRSGHMYEKAAHDVYRDCDLVLAAFKTCERIVTTPIPYQYTHMVNLVLFCFVFSAPLIFTVTFKWLTPFPSAILALGFYGIWEVGKTMMDPFDWNSPRVDLTEVGKRVATEAQRIVEAGQHRYSIFAAERDAPRAQSRTRPRAFFYFRQFHFDDAARSRIDDAATVVRRPRIRDRPSLEHHTAHSAAPKTRPITIRTTPRVPCVVAALVGNAAPSLDRRRPRTGSPRRRVPM